MTDDMTAVPGVAGSTSRRMFLGGGGAAVAALTLGGTLLSACSSGDKAGDDKAAGDGDQGGDKPATVVRNVRPFGGPATDLIAVNGILAQSVPDGVGVQYIDGGGRLAVPTLIDSHIHPEKTGWGEPWQSRRAASTTEEFVDADVAFAKGLHTPPAERALRLMSHAAAQGTRAMRAHADIAPVYGLDGVKALAAARDKLKGIVDVQIVAFPQLGVVRTPGTAELMDEAASQGLIDYVGGIDPSTFDKPTPAGNQLDTIFGIAEKHKIGLDIHLHEVDEDGLGPLRDIIARTNAAGLRGKVTVSHGFAIAKLEGAQLDTLADQLAAADIALTTVALSGSTVLPYQRLAERGVRVGLGSDGVRDSWSPFGNADMLHRVWLLGWANDARTDDELSGGFHLAADGGAKVMGLPISDLKPGSPADFMLIEGENVPQIVVDVPPRAVVLRGGRVVAKDGNLL